MGPREIAERLLRSGLLAAAAALLAAVLAPAGATAAETRSFFKIGEEFPSGGNNLQFGPAPDYPSTIAVSGVPGTVTKVTVTIFALSSANPDDIDMAIVGPNGAQVMLMSDACGDLPKQLSDNTWTFDDAAPTFLSDNGPCPTDRVGSFKPSNYENPELDNLSKEGGGPPPPYTNALADLAGGAPDGSWKLFVLDDGPLTPGFFFDAWGLTLEIEPPPAVGPPAPSEPAPKRAKKRTGKRARALAKCKAKPTKKARKRCRKNAKKLPV